MGVEGWSNWGEISQLINIWKGFSVEKSSEFRNELRRKLSVQFSWTIYDTKYWQMQ